MKVPQERLFLLNAGKVASNNLNEGLAVDFAALLSAAVPAMPADKISIMQEAASLGILKRMWLAGQLLNDEFGSEVVSSLKAHESDTVRGWACFILSMAQAPSVKERLRSVLEFANDSHFGVREWAWLAMRPHIAEQLEESIAFLSSWTSSPSERIRRFSCESIRPRGVWRTHIGILKNNPALGLPILESLCGDCSSYVQDSVGNWLNDAAKTQPMWVQELCARWKVEKPGKATDRICKRALRSISK